VKAVIVGPGRVGCGFAAPALSAAGYELVFVGRDPAVVDHLNRTRSYEVRLVQGRHQTTQTVGNVRALGAEDVDGVAHEIAAADLVVVAVGARNLGAAAPLIAAGLRLRSRPVNVLCFENLADAGARLRSLVCEQVTSPRLLDGHGFAGALVSRAVARRLGDPRGPGPLIFVGDPPEDFKVERRALGPPLPELPGMTVVDDYAAAVRAKLYIFSAGHAAAAYLGFLKGYRYVHSAMRDPDVRMAVIGAMSEGRLGVAAACGPRYSVRTSELWSIAARFQNAALHDPLERVGRDPCRKLGFDDRLIGSARLALRAGIRPENLAIAAAAAFCFDCPGDGSARELQGLLDDVGIEGALSRVAGLELGDPLGHRIASAWLHVRDGRPRENVLLSLQGWNWAARPAGELAA
jgi:mannitol-1-phosphate 5-dehydrogenase